MHEVLIRVWDGPYVESRDLIDLGIVMDSALLLSPSTEILCPKCATPFSLEQGFARQALDSVTASSAAALADLKSLERAAAEKHVQLAVAERERDAAAEAEDLRRRLKSQGDAHLLAMADLQAMTETGFTHKINYLQEQLARSQTALADVESREAALKVREKTIAAEIQEAAQQRTQLLIAEEKTLLERRLQEKEAQVAELRTAELSLRQQKTALEDRASALELEVVRKLDEGRSEIETRVRGQEQERSSLREAEYQKTISDMKEKLSEAQRKADQGSQQMQGEVLEIAIEEALRRAFPLDQVEEVKKGVRGGDIVQRVSNRAGQVAGVVLWESKRAKEWSSPWITKLKEDMRGCSAEVGVLVTVPSAVPRDWHAGQMFGLSDGVWVTTWSTAIQLAEVLRSGLLDCHKQRLTSAGKGEKMEAIYDYLTSAHFAQKLRAVFDTFTKMREELESEKSQSLQRWARREKQMQTGMTALLGIGGEIQGLAQQELPELELAPFALVAPGA